MGSHPLNLIIRFLLELAALIAAGNWGWKQNDGWTRWVLVIGIPLLIAIVWGTFAVPNDPSRSGTAPVVTPGTVRLIIELAILAFAVWTLFDSGFVKLSWLMGSAVVIHYMISYDRIFWLLSQ